MQTSSNPRYDNYSSEEAGASVDMEMAMDDDIGYAETSAAFTTVDFSGTQIQYDIAYPTPYHLLLNQFLWRFKKLIYLLHTITILIQN